MKRYLNEITTKQTPQKEQAVVGQVPNSEGGFVWAVDVWGRLQRFLILGSEGGSYYASERDLTKENVDVIAQALTEDYKRAIDTIVEISLEGRAPSNDPAIFALAMAAGFERSSNNSEHQKVRRYALSQLNKVCRIGTHIFTFAEYVQNFRGWGRALRTAISNWYLDRAPEKLAYQLVKYRQRGGWTHRDLMRKSHPLAWEDGHQWLFKWVTRPENAGDIPETQWGQFVNAYETAKTETNINNLVKIIVDNSLPREAIPTQFLRDAKVWDALLPSMPVTAMLRNLGNMTAAWLITPTSDATRFVVGKLSDREWLKRGRVHPLSVLNTLNAYSGGRRLRGRRGSDASRAQGKDWMPVPAVVDQLNDTFHKTFDLVEPTNRRLLLALDVSSSMSWSNIAGMALSPAEATAAMALVTAHIEPFYQTVAFKHEISTIDITRGMRLQDAYQRVREQQFGGTDCALPMIYAKKRNLDVDTFIVYTDNETWAGDIHPFQALREYREKTGINAQLIVVAMVSNGFSIADPNDRGMLDIVGFDTAAPTVMHDFILGKV